jgi:hypothetical protein
VTLRDYIDKHYGGSQAAFAAVAKIDRGQLCKYLKAERGEGGGRPNSDNLARLEQTAGKGFGATYWSTIDPGANLRKSSGRRSRRKIAPPDSRHAA